MTLGLVWPTVKCNLANSCVSASVVMLLLLGLLQLQGPASLLGQLRRRGPILDYATFGVGLWDRGFVLGLGSWRLDLARVA